MRKSVVNALYSGIFKHSIGAKTGIFSTFTTQRSHVVIANKKRCKNKKIAAQFGAVRATIGALPFFVASQKLGATSCSK